jgi:hypothetical protein
MYLTSFSVSVVCGAMPKNPDPLAADPVASGGVVAAEAGVVVPWVRR